MIFLLVARPVGLTVFMQRKALPMKCICTCSFEQTKIIALFKKSHNAIRPSAKNCSKRGKRMLKLTSESIVKIIMYPHRFCANLKRLETHECKDIVIKNLSS